MNGLCVEVYNLINQPEVSTSAPIQESLNMNSDFEEDIFIKIENLAGLKEKGIHF